MKLADNYTVLYDKVIKVANENGGDRFYKIIKKNIRVNQPCHWDDGGNRGDGHVFVFWFTDITSQPETAPWIPAVFMSARTTFTDV